MEFYYSGSIKVLKNFYLSMRKINVQVGTFGTMSRKRTHKIDKF